MVSLTSPYYEGQARVGPLVDGLYLPSYRALIVIIETLSLLFPRKKVTGQFVLVIVYKIWDYRDVVSA